MGCPFYDPAENQGKQAPTVCLFEKERIFVGYLSQSDTEINRLCRRRRRSTSVGQTLPKGRKIFPITFSESKYLEAGRFPSGLTDYRRAHRRQARAPFDGVLWRHPTSGASSVHLRSLSPNIPNLNDCPAFLYNKSKLQPQQVPMSSQQVAL